MEERLNEIEVKLNRLILLMEVQINGEKLHEVGGYAYGRTSAGAAFVILYPASDHLKHKVCRVYEEDFNKLPTFINTAVIPDSAQEGNPDREQAIRQKIYRPCPPFKIATRDGKETQMGPEVRFSRTVEAPAVPAPKPAVKSADKKDIFDYRYGDGTEATPEAGPHFAAYRRENGEQAPASRAALGQWCKEVGRI